MPCIPPDIPVFGPNRIYIRLRSRVCHILVCHIQMGLHHHPPTCLCCCSCCCSSCSLSVSNTTGSTRIIKEVVPTQSAVREKLEQVNIEIKLCCLCHFCFHLISAALKKCTRKASWWVRQSTAQRLQHPYGPFQETSLSGPTTFPPVSHPAKGDIYKAWHEHSDQKRCQLHC